MENEEKIDAVIRHLELNAAMTRQMSCELDFLTTVVLELCRSVSRQDRAAADGLIRAATQQVAQQLQDMADHPSPELERRLTLLLATVRESAGSPPQRG